MAGPAAPARRRASERGRAPFAAPHVR